MGYGDTLTEGEEKARRREGMAWWEGESGREWALSLQRLSGTRGRGPPYVCLRPDPAPSVLMFRGAWTLLSLVVLETVEPIHPRLLCHPRS